jgi:bacillithiol biosynthesis cysteine-adding enzyme BshC
MIIPTKQLPQLPHLVDDYFYNYSKVQEFYNGDFREPAAFERQTERVQSRHLLRPDLAAVLREQNRNYGCGPQTLEQIDKIVQKHACAVVTGQQVGLFSGPLYTIYKALTAIKLSARLNQLRVGSFVPIFWLASDDHDLAEIDHVALLDKDSRLKEVRCRMPLSEGKIPASNLILPSDVLDCLQQLNVLTPDTEFKSEIIGELRDAYEPGRSFVDAFARWMTRLFKSAGLIFIDASHPRLREMGSDVFCHEIADQSPSTRRAIAASQMLRQAGYATQIPLHVGILNIFYLDRERRTIQWEDEAFVVKETKSSRLKEDLLNRAKEKPELFSPNVLLRPIYQDALLPTVAYVGGQAEIAYFAQLKGVYEAFGLPMPVVYPRKNVTIVEKKVDHILKKYKVTIADLWSHPAEIVARISRQQIPDGLDKALHLVSAHLEQDFDSVKMEMALFEPALKGSVNLAERKMHQQLKFLEKKILRAAAKRDETAVRQLHKAIANLYPKQHLQERVFNIVPYLTKYGYSFMDKLDRATDMDEHNHQIMFI